MGRIKHRVGSLLRRAADRVDPRPNNPVIHIKPPTESEIEKFKAELKRLDRNRGMGLT